LLVLFTFIHDIICCITCHQQLRLFSWYLIVMLNIFEEFWSSFKQKFLLRVNFLNLFFNNPTILLLISEKVVKKQCEFHLPFVYFYFININIKYKIRILLLAIHRAAQSLVPAQWKKVFRAAKYSMIDWNLQNCNSFMFLITWWCNSEKTRKIKQNCLNSHLWLIVIDNCKRMYRMKQKSQKIIRTSPMFPT
jgi:hypothetical protein